MTTRLEFKADLTVTSEGLIEGIAWPFGSADRVGDVIEKGAFASVAAPIPMLFQHDQSQVIGVWDEITESNEGLTVKGHLLVQDVARAREVHGMILAKAVTGLSIGFQTKAATPRVRGRTITALDLLEVSIVAVPSHPGAKITSAKSAGDDPAYSITGENMEPETLAVTPAQTTPANDAPGIDLKAFNEVKARLDRMEAKAARPAAVTITGPAMSGDQKAFTDYLRSGDATELKALAANTGTGGILAPETVASTIIEKIAEFSPVRNVAQVIQMNGPLLQLPRLVTEVSPAPVAEGAAKPESEPTFEQIDVKPFEMGVVVPVTKTLLEDAQVDLSAYLANHVARRFGQIEANWFVTGNGTAQAQGVLTSAEVQELEFATITGDALTDLFYSVKTAYSSSGVWMMNRGTMSIIRKLKDSDGQYIWQPGLAAGQPASLLGRPVYEAVDMPNATAGETPVVFGDFASGYAVADRVGFEVLRDDYTGAVNGIVKFIARRRVGGRVILGEALSKLAIAA